MTETVIRLAVVTHLAHGHHWAIRPRQLDVCSRAIKHVRAARWNFVPCIRSGVHVPPTRKGAVSASYEAAERPKTVASQPVSHRRRPLEVAIFIIGGTDKYQQTDHALTDLLVCRSCSEVACGVCRPLACIMAWAHRKVELSKIVPRGNKNA